MKVKTNVTAGQMDWWGEMGPAQHEELMPFRFLPWE